MSPNITDKNDIQIYHMMLKVLEKIDGVLKEKGKMVIKTFKNSMEVENYFNFRMNFAKVS